MKKLLTFLFFLSVASTIVGNYYQLPELRFLAKPLIMVFLAWLFSMSVNNLTQSKKIWVLLAFMFSWVGDIALMFADDTTKAPGFYFFIAGLVSFLTAHVCYIVVFRKIAAQFGSSGFNTLKLMLATPVALVVGILIFKILPSLGSMTIPVVVYAIIISTMAMAAIALYGVLTKQSFIAIYFGAILFLVSDTTLAVNQFVSSSPLLGIVVMLTYGSAQYYIMQGVVSLNSRPKAVEKVI
ncbi:lysoplasmalogenase [Solitalea lacus]|uniref:lysoplasmalogenase n=1 Tax=Solitalea lacus TaxID=2911172 RepID=UPI001EDB8047|nr:lysoplasmalogenase [Solitalea lacus]UKJ08732.1 lysoplasmalogenase [Solitalea lacus]